MPDVELTDRLRDAFALPHEPRPGRDVRASISTRLPRYRNRRRATLGGSFGGLATALALVLVLALGGFSSAPSKPPAIAFVDLSCVEVQIGTAQPHCAGHVYLNVTGLSNSGQAFGPQLARPEQAGPAQSVHTVRVAPGRRITVSLPKRSGLAWSSVTLQALSATGPPGTGDTAVPTSRGPHGRTVAVIDHAPVGGYSLVALATPPCPSGQGCSAAAVGWFIELLVD